VKKRTYIGKLPPQYTFILNPYPHTRFSRCPTCEQKMHQRKVPLFIHVDPLNPVVLGYTCRYCPNCDLLIAHQDWIEDLLANLFAARDPSIIGNDYLVLGTVERTAWREGMKEPKGIQEMLEHLHDFKEVLTVEVQPAGWYAADGPPFESTARGASCPDQESRASRRSWKRPKKRKRSRSKRR
jgi:hypothetical protein